MRSWALFGISRYLFANNEEVCAVGKNHYPFIRPVICASGDKFIADETKKRTLNHDFKADICDMESVAIVLICDQNNIPNLILKTVSDSITGGAAEFRSSIEKAADICLEILDDILKEL